MSNARYYDFFGKEISKSEFEKFSTHLLQVHNRHLENEPQTAPLSPHSIREYRNAKLCVQLKWIGVVSEADFRDLFKLSYKLFTVEILNFINDEWRVEPTEKFFSKLADASNYYEEILLKYTKSTMDEEGGVIYDDNNECDCVHEKITLEDIAEGTLPTIVSKPKTVIDDAW